MNDWWSEAVEKIYADALAAMDGDESPLRFGPGHIVWDDGNFDDDDIRFCLDLCDSQRASFLDRFDEADLEIVRASLEGILAIPRADRGNDPADEQWEGNP